MTRWLVNRSSRSDIERGLERLDALRASVPDYAPAWALTAGARRRLGDFDAALQAARHAVDLDPNLATGHYQLARAAMYLFRFDEALAGHRRATELAPGIASYQQWYAQILANMRRFDEALQRLEFARTLDPISASIVFDFSAVYLAAGRYDDALAHCTHSLELMPDRSALRECQVSAHYYKGNVSTAIEVAREVMRRGEATEADMTRLDAADPKQAIFGYFRWYLERSEARRDAGESVRPYTFARAYGQLEDRENTLTVLRGIVERRATTAVWIARDRMFGFLHGDPEFEALLRQVGLPPTSVRL